AGPDVLHIRAAGNRGWLRLSRRPDGRGRDRARNRGPGHGSPRTPGVRGSGPAPRGGFLLGPLGRGDAAHLRGGASRLPPAARGAGAADRMRTAVVHDWLNGMRGGEKVLEAILPLVPNPTIFTLFHVPGSVSPATEGSPHRA